MKPAKKPGKRRAANLEPDDGKKQLKVTDMFKKDPKRAENIFLSVINNDLVSPYWPIQKAGKDNVDDSKSDLMDEKKPSNGSEMSPPERPRVC